MEDVVWVTIRHGVRIAGDKAAGGDSMASSYMSNKAECFSVRRTSFIVRVHGLSRMSLNVELHHLQCAKTALNLQRSHRGTEGNRGDFGWVAASVACFDSPLSGAYSPFSPFCATFLPFFALYLGQRNTASSRQTLLQNFLRWNRTCKSGLVELHTSNLLEPHSG